jgi:glycosyltransferase involved in cell wall biosynthesis
VVIDAGTSDDTAEIARSEGAIAIQAGGVGKGFALRAGFEKAHEMIPDAVVTLDGDGQYDPSYIPSLMKSLPNTDLFLVNGSRLLDSRNHKLFPETRYYGNLLAARAASYVAKNKITDALSGMRVYSGSLCKALRVSSFDFGADLQLLFDSCRLGARYVERSITPIYDDKHTLITRKMVVDVVENLAKYLTNLEGDSNHMDIYYSALLNDLEKCKTFSSTPPMKDSPAPNKLHVVYHESLERYEIS